MKDTKAFFVFIVLGLTFLSLAYFSKYFLQNKNEYSQILGNVFLKNPTAVVFRKDFSKKEDVVEKVPIYQQDSIETAENGEALLVLDNGYSVKWAPQTAASIEILRQNQTSNIVIRLKKGSVEVEKFGSDTDLYIEKNGKLIRAAIYNDSEIAKSPVTPMFNDRQSLGEEEIFKTMSSHKQLFQKCYTQLLQRNPLAKGSVNLSFTIETTGSIDQFNFQSSNINETAFSDCLKAVLERIQFRSFSGEAITTMFPLKFD